LGIAGDLIRLFSNKCQIPETYLHLEKVQKIGEISKKTQRYICSI